MPGLVARLAGGAVGVVALGCILYVAATYGLAFARSPRPPRLWRVAILELGATLLLMTLWPLWWLLGASYKLVEEGTGPRRRPVILLHGFAMNRSQWLWLGRSLIARGVGPLYGTSYFSPQAVAASARHLQKFVAYVMAREDAEQVDIVAHSLGGVVARYYIEQLSGAQHVGRLVTLGSPHRGTRLGRLGLSLIPSARELVSESELLLGLRPAAAVQYTSIWSRADAVVIPPESSSVAPHGTDQVFDDLGHLSMLLSPRVAAAIAERLQS
jgi:triacylglycerol esterase/lipase EstA (alpha/beta hydrolase family)